MVKVYSHTAEELIRHKTKKTRKYSNKVISVNELIKIVAQLSSESPISLQNELLKELISLHLRTN